MAYTNIDKGSEYFNTVLYTGNGTVESNTQAITGVGFSPDLVWIKMRSGTDGNILEDSVRGVGRYLISNSTGSEGGGGTGLLDSFDSDGFTVNCDEGGNVFNSSTNGNGSTYVSWSWRGSDTSAVSNTAGSITSTVSANTTSGFSIVSYTGTGSVGTVGHGLGVEPKMIITKGRNDSVNWWGVYHASLGNTKALFLNQTSTASTNSSFWNNTSPTSSVFTVNNDAISNTNTTTYIAYCFADVKGYSKFGSWISNGSSTADAFVYTGFKPSFVILKMATSASSWFMYDNKRVPYNASNVHLLANSSGAEDTSSNIDFYSNGFRSNGLFNSYSGQTIIYMAFAESPFVSSKGIPTTAR
jgi:hypothetical protein